MESKKFNKLVSSSVYGLIITATLLFTLENYEHSSWDMAITIFLTIIAVSTAEYYVQMFHNETKISSFRNIFKEVSSDSLNMVAGSMLPIIFFFFSGLGIISILSAFSLGEATVAILLAFAGYYYGKSRGRNNKISILYGIVNLGLVSFVIFLELWAHHQRL